MNDKTPKILFFEKILTIQASAVFILLKSGIAFNVTNYFLWIVLQKIE